MSYNEQFYIDRVGPTLAADYNEAHRQVGDDAQWVVWPARVNEDINLGKPPEVSLVKHRGEWRAALGLAPVVNPNTLCGAFCIPTQPTRVWWPAFLGVSSAEQDRYIHETLSRGYNFGEILVSGLPYGNDYARIPPDGDRLAAGLVKMKTAGLTTVIAFDDSRGPDLNYLKPVLAGNEDLIDWCMGIYEVNGVFKDPAIVLSILKQCRALLPNTRLAVHFTPLDEGNPSYGLVDFRRAQIEAGLNAIFFQTAGWVNQQASIDRIQDFTRRFMNGFRGYPILSHGVVDFENSTTKTYRYLWTEQQAVQLTDAIMNAPLEPDNGVRILETDPFMMPQKVTRLVSNLAVRPNGFCDGGSVS